MDEIDSKVKPFNENNIGLSNCAHIYHHSVSMHSAYVKANGEMCSGNDDTHNNNELTAETAHPNLIIHTLHTYYIHIQYQYAIHNLMDSLNLKAFLFDIVPVSLDEYWRCDFFVVFVCAISLLCE